MQISGLASKLFREAAATQLCELRCPRLAEQACRFFHQIIAGLEKAVAQHMGPHRMVQLGSVRIKSCFKPSPSPCPGSGPDPQERSGGERFTP